MPDILIVTNSSKVKYNTFTYTINASFNGLTGPINSAQITTFVPSYIAYKKPAIVPPLKGIMATPGTNGTDTGMNIVFDFEKITDLGQAIVVIFGMSFKLGTPNGTEYLATYNLIADGIKVGEMTAQAVVLSLEPKWILTKSMVIPSNGQPTAGSTAYYLIKLQNIGDPEVLISDVMVTDTMPHYLTLDTSFTPIGTDWSGVDSSANGNGMIEAQTVVFTIPKYIGSNYYMVYKVMIDPNVEIGTAIVNTVDWVIGGIVQPAVTYTARVANAYIQQGIGKYGPITSKPGNQINYELYVKNSGNEDIFNAYVIDQIPDEIIIQRVYPGSFALPTINQFPDERYTVSYELNHSNQFNKLGTFPYKTTNYWAYEDLTHFLELPTDKVTALRWDFPVAPVGIAQYNPPRIDGIVDPYTGATATVNTVSVNWEDVQGKHSNSASVRTSLNGRAQIKGVLHNTPNSNVVPGDIINYEGVFSCWSSQVDDPVLIDLLPPEVEYIGNIRIAYSEYFNKNAYYDLNTPNTPIPQPVVEVIPNFNSNGKINTLVRIKLIGFSIKQRSELFIRFDTKVKVGAIGSVSNKMYFANKGISQVPDGDVEKSYVDTIDLDVDNYTTNDRVALSNTATNEINFSTSLAIDKKVMGELDGVFTEYPGVGMTTEGGKVDYKLTITNTGNVDLESFELIDILPHEGDAGVILTKTIRGSNFPIYVTGQVQALLTPLVPGQTVPVLEIQYSNSYDPIRFNSLGTGTIGAVNDWKNTPPTLYTDIRAVKLTSKNTKLIPGQSLVINISAVAPVGVAANLVAWNSYALLGTYYDPMKALKTLLPVEPEKVGIQIQQPIEKVSIGQLVWIDTNKDGIKNPDEVGVNDIEVELYDVQGKFVKRTVTAYDSHHNPGYYLFTNLTPGVYTVKFILPVDYSMTKPYLKSGKTGLIYVLVPGTKELTVNAGIYKSINIVQKQALDMILVSIGMEELAHAHIVNAEAEKMQFALGTLETAQGKSVSLEQVLEVNRSANKMMRDVIKNQLLMSMQMEDIIEIIN